MSASDLDLGNAIEAGARALHYIEHGPWISGLGIEPGGTPWGTSRELARRDEYRAHATDILTAALPHILDALVDWFETEDPETLNGDDREFECVAVYLQALKQAVGA